VGPTLSSLFAAVAMQGTAVPMSTPSNDRPHGVCEIVDGYVSAINDAAMRLR